MVTASGSTSPLKIGKLRRPDLFRRPQHNQPHPGAACVGDPDGGLRLIRSLIEEIRLVPESGALRIELKGELAGIRALAADSKQPGGLSAAGLAGCKQRWLRGRETTFTEPLSAGGESECRLAGPTDRFNRGAPPPLAKLSMAAIGL